MKLNLKKKKARSAKARSAKAKQSLTPVVQKVQSSVMKTTAKFIREDDGTVAKAVYAYGTSQTGTSHIKAGTVCQDAHAVMTNDDGIMIAAVADGLGSEQHSDMASALAVKTAAAYCAEKLVKSSLSEDAVCIIREAFEHAKDAIEAEALSLEYEFDQCDTTLSLAVYADGDIYYGHSGDSGIITLGSDGKYVRLTKQQRDDEGRVFPLFAEDKWEFGKAEGKAASVLLATDGMLDAFSPVYIRDTDQDLYIQLLMYFMDKDKLRIDELGAESVCESRNTYVESIAGDKVDDDKTVVVMADTGVDVVPQPYEYYAAPDWDKVIREWRENYEKNGAYPGLKTDTESPEADSAVELAAEAPVCQEVAEADVSKPSKAEEDVCAKEETE
jgi:serine/threonine protein phosphatase PrpC